MVWGSSVFKGSYYGESSLVFTPDAKHFVVFAGSVINVFSVSTGEKLRSLNTSTSEGGGTVTERNHHQQGESIQEPKVEGEQHEREQIIQSSKSTTTSSSSSSISRGPVTSLFLRRQQHHGAALIAEGGIEENRHYVYCSCLNGFVQVWDLEEATMIQEYDLGNMQVLDMFDDPTRKSSDTVYLLCESGNGKCVLWYTLSTGENKMIIPNANLLCVSDSGNIVAGAKKRQLFVFNVQTGTTVSFSQKKVITALAIHPQDAFVATGCTSGAIHFWFPGNATPKRIHWHAHPVGALAFTRDNMYILSGGEEAVLVSTHVETAQNTFLPRLGSAVKHISISSDGSFYGLILTDNTLLIINSITKKLQLRIQGLRRISRPPQLAIDPKRNLLVANSADLLQFYDPIFDKHVSDFEVSSYNKVRGPVPIPEPLILHFTFSGDGSKLVTVEKRQLMRERIELTLKFWQYDDNKQKFVLTTQVAEPSDSLDSIAFHPSQNLLVTTSISDKQFKLWTQVDVTESKAPVYSWICRAIGTYRGLPPAASAFSWDGSLLVIAFQEVLTFWNPTTMSLLQELSHSTEEQIRHVSFVPQTSYMISTTTKGYLYVWDLLTCEIWWSVRIDAKLVTVDPNGGRFLVATNSGKGGNHLVLFDIRNPKPLWYWKLSVPLVSTIFVTSAVMSSHKSAASSAIISLQDDQQLLVMEEFIFDKPKPHSTANNNSVPLKHGSANKPFYMPPTSLQQETQATKISHPSGNPTSLFNTSSHVLPPLPTLYSAFMGMLIARDHSEDPVIQSTTTTTETSTEDMEVDSQEQQPLDETSLDEENGVFTLNYERYQPFVDYFKEQFGAKTSNGTGKAQKNGATPSKTNSTPKRSKNRL